MEQVKTRTKFITRHRNSWTGVHEQVEVKGEICFEMYGHQFFLHNYCSGRFTVSEVSTGFNVTKTHATRKAKAIQDAKDKLFQTGEERFLHGMEKARRIIETYKH